MTAIKIPAPSPPTPTRRSRMRPAYFAIPVALAGAAAIVAYSQKPETVAAPSRPGRPVVEQRVTPPKALLPTYPDQATLEAKAAATTPAERTHYLGFDPVAGRPQGWLLAPYDKGDAVPVFEFGGTKLIGFSVANTDRLLTPAEFYDPNFDAENLLTPAERARRLKNVEDIVNGK